MLQLHRYMSVDNIKSYICFTGPCPPIPHVTNGQGLDTGNTVQYACEPGFVLEGTNVITCIDGRWTVAPRCRRRKYKEHALSIIEAKSFKNN